MSAEEYQSWELFEQYEPFGDVQADYRAGVIASRVHNMSLKVTKKRYLIEPEEFFQSLDKNENARLTPEATADMFAMMPGAVLVDERHSEAGG